MTDSGELILEDEDVQRCEQHQHRPVGIHDDCEMSERVTVGHCGEDGFMVSYATETAV